MPGDESKKRLADYLPYEYRKRGEKGEETDTLKFLKAFDRILLGNDNASASLAAIEGLEDKIARLADFFHPARTPSEFLPWLSQWVALTLRADISEEKQREFIARIVTLYRRRGTKDNMVELLELFTGRKVSVTEIDAEPHFFTVLLDLNNVKEGNRQADYDRAEQQAHSIIRLAKPAHTRYQLIPKIDAFRIGPYNSCTKDPNIKSCPIIVGRNTRLGIADWK
jgi:phage tail-like protein